jgi:signal transduction histidine kinase/CheY-like chemotaxis protein
VLIYDDVYDEPEVAEFTKDYFPSNNITSMLDAPFYKAGKLAGVICLEHVDTPRVWTLEEQSFVISLADILTIVYESKRLAEVESSLKHAEKMEALGKLTGGIAHDFNNMLGVVMGYSDLLVNTLDQSDPSYKYAKQIQKASQRGAKLTTNLLSFSRKKVVQQEEVDLAEFLLGQKELIQKTLTVAVNINYEIDKESWPVWIDKSEMEHALLNMCINAMHATETEESPEITIRLLSVHLASEQTQDIGLTPGDYVLLEFIDNGCGIPADNIGHIFDPFYTTKGEKGTGLGLAQVFSFMKAGNGGIYVNSELGQGAHFSLYFPRHYNQAELDLSVSEKSLSADQLTGREHILIVDDEVALSDLAAEILGDQGYKTTTLHSAVDALKFLETHSVDLVLTDIVMPEMDGYVFASTILDKYPTMKIQLMSGYSSNQTKSMVSQVLLDNIIRKPFQPKELLEKVRRLLDA